MCRTYLLWRVQCHYCAKLNSKIRKGGQKLSKFKNVGFCFASGAAVVAGLTLLFNMTAAGAASDGSKIYAESCASCHAKGGNILDPKKAVKGSKILASKKAFKDFLLKQNGSMPAYPHIANNDADLTALFDYCKSLK